MRGERFHQRASGDKRARVCVGKREAGERKRACVCAVGEQRSDKLCAERWSERASAGGKPWRREREGRREPAWWEIKKGCFSTAFPLASYLDL